MRPLIVFDLDGTLVDSAAGVARYATSALQAQGLPGTVHEQDVGPRLATTLSLASGLDVSDPRLLQAVEACKKAYDPICHELCVPFDGARTALEALAETFDLAVATNKREGATRQILRAFALAPYFGQRVYCAGDPGAISKAETLARLKAERGGAYCAMVGDTSHDWQAAQEGLFDQFYVAGWGARREFGPSVPDGTVAAGQALPNGSTIKFTKLQSFDHLPGRALREINP